MLGRVAEALGAYKMLLYHAPQDGDAARIVAELETQVYRKGTLVLRTDLGRGMGTETAPTQVASAPIEATESWEVLETPRPLRPPALSWAARIAQVEKLQGLLQKVERYRARVAAGNRA
jgi:hypothetical protein